jgi:hypothetical protein
MVSFDDGDQRFQVLPTHLRELPEATLYPIDRETRR